MNDIYKGEKLKMIKIDGVNYKIRYTYKREDGTEWFVLMGANNLYGEFGDEWPVSQSTKY